METEVIKVDVNSSPPELLSDEGINKAARLLQQDETVAFPTETVYGLGANALSEEAVKKIFSAKGRPEDNPLIVHISRREQLDELVEGSLKSEVRELAARFWPGPLTMILPRSQKVPALTCGGLDTVAIRMPSHPVARALLTRAGLPVAAPSANLSGLPSPTRADHVLIDMEGRIPLIIDGGESPIGVESTVIDMTTSPPRLLRPGGVSTAQLKQALGEEMELERGYDVENDEVIPRSPGMKYRHYAPRAELELLLTDDPREIWNYARGQEKYRALLLTEDTLNKISSIPRDKVYKNPTEGKDKRFKIVPLGRAKRPEDIAHNLFTFLRQLDEEGRELIMVEGIDPSGLGEAIMNRLRKAASNIIEF